MIFLTTGTQLGFDRLVQAVDEWAAETDYHCEIFGQVLLSSNMAYVPRNFRTKERLTPNEYVAIFSQANLIVSHAGMGTILTALTQGKRVCIMPRQMKYGEHRNDHQLATVERLRDYPSLFKAKDKTDLKRCINEAILSGAQEQASPIGPFADSDFTDRLRNFIAETGEV